MKRCLTVGLALFMSISLLGCDVGQEEHDITQTLAQIEIANWSAPL